MDKASHIKELMRKITGTDRLTFDFMPMEVVSVEGDLCTCLLDELELPDVRLVAIPDGSEDGLLITPKVGSMVMVADLSAGHLRDLMVVNYTEVESIRFHQGSTTITADGEKVAVEVGASTIEITDGLINMNGGKLGGIFIIQKLIDRVNEIIQAFNSHTHQLEMNSVVITDSMGGTGMNPSPVPVPPVLQPHNTIDDITPYEDDTILH
ncbi:MAG: hypothetical protein LUF04_16170 [Bacteroides sp.]|nr:hypothetical protein [Bacteroides sp.]